MRPPAGPPTTAPAIAPAMTPRVTPGLCAFVMFAVPCRSSTCDSSCAITPTTSSSRVGRLDHAAVDEHRPARQGEGVDVLLVDGRERELEQRVPQVVRRGGDEPLAEPIEEPVDLGVLDDRELLPALGRGLPAELDVLLGRVLVLGRDDARLREAPVPTPRTSSDRAGHARRRHPPERHRLHAGRLAQARRSPPLTPPPRVRLV